MDTEPIEGQAWAGLAMVWALTVSEEDADGVRQEEAAGVFLDMAGTATDYTVDLVMEGDLVKAGWEDITICVSEEGAGTGSWLYK